MKVLAEETKDSNLVQITELPTKLAEDINAGIYPHPKKTVGGGVLIQVIEISDYGAVDKGVLNLTEDTARLLNKMLTKFLKS